MYNGAQTVTANMFNALCCEALVHPAIALENDEIVEALRRGDDARVKALLREEI